MTGAYSYLIIDGCLFDKNVAEDRSGILFTKYSTTTNAGRIYISNSIFTENEARESIFILQHSDMHIYNVQMDDNNA